MQETKVKSVLIFSPSLQPGGAERVALDLANWFSQKGIKVFLVLARNLGGFVEEIGENISVVDLRTDHTFQTIPKLIGLIRDFQPTIILSFQTQANVAILLASLLSNCHTPVIPTEHSTISINLNRKGLLKEKLLLPLAHILYHQAPALISVSRKAADDLISTLHLDSKKVRVIYNPINLGKITNCSQEEYHHPWLTPGSPPLLLAVGRLTEAKGFSDLIRAIALVLQKRPVNLMIVGEGEKRTELENQIKALGLENFVELNGFMANPYTVLSKADLFVSSSLWEGFGVAIVEALACGIKVVATDCLSGPAEILENGKFGMLVPPENPQLLADAILWSLDTNAPSPDAKERANDFSIDKIGHQYLSLFEEVLSAGDGK
jgi:glycosyltransferase involved in cell wall biosynthesis